MITTFSSQQQTFCSMEKYQPGDTFKNLDSSDLHQLVMSHGQLKKVSFRLFDLKLVCIFQLFLLEYWRYLMELIHHMQRRFQ